MERDQHQMWQVGLARESILPTEPMPLAGYFDRQGMWTEFTSDLNAKAMAVQDAAGNQAVLLTAEICGFTADLAEAICAKIQQRLGLGRASILLNGSHTHSAPLSMGPKFPMPHPDDGTVERYFQQVVDKISGLAEAAFANMSPARLSWGSGVADFVINRRVFTENGVILGANPRGLCDRTVPVLRVDGADGRMRAVVFGAACHNVTNPYDSLAIDGDYAGHAQAFIEQNLPGVQSMFVIGCAGDARPHPRGGNDLARRHGQSLGTEVLRVLCEELSPVSGPLRCALEYVDLTLQDVPREAIEKLRDEGIDYYEHFAKGALAILDRGERLPDVYRAPFAMWQFGEDLTVVAMCGEVVVDYVPLIEQAIGPLRLWIAGYCNDVFGYLPSVKVLAEGGYETRGLYTGIGLFAEDVQKQTIQAVERLARQVNRPRAEKTISVCNQFERNSNGNNS